MSLDTENCEVASFKNYENYLTTVKVITKNNYNFFIRETVFNVLLKIVGASVGMYQY